MSKIQQDINDDEIRIISSENKMIRNTSPKRSKNKLFIAIFIIAVAIGLSRWIIYIFWNNYNPVENHDELELVTNNAPTPNEEILPDIAISKQTDHGYVAITDTIINEVPLSIFKPVNLTPTLHIGMDILNDSTALFVVQAADVRGDNGGIVGAYVKEGELLSKGQAKSGFCAIIGGKLTIGVADATPFLEQALETDGYFFRQYPLVVANQIVENKPKGKSFRKALAELDGQIAVIMSKERMTFHDFSRSLVDLGVANAIYLVGSTAYGFAIGSEGEKVEFGQNVRNMFPNTNYIVWR